MIADLFEAVLERVVGDPVRTFTFAVLLDRRSCALANVRCALGGDLRSVLGSSLFLAGPLFVVFGIVVHLHRKRTLVAAEAGITCTRAAFLDPLRTWCATSNGSIRGLPERRCG